MPRRYGGPSALDNIRSLIQQGGGGSGDDPRLPDTASHATKKVVVNDGGTGFEYVTDSSGGINNLVEDRWLLLGWAEPSMSMGIRLQAAVLTLALRQAVAHLQTIG